MKQEQYVPVKASSGSTRRSKPSLFAAASSSSARAMFCATCPRTGANWRVAMCMMGVGGGGNGT